MNFYKLNTTIKIKRQSIQAPHKPLLAPHSNQYSKGNYYHDI